MIHDYTRLSYESQSPDIQRALFTDHPIATLDDHPVRSSRWNLRRGTRGKAALMPGDVMYLFKGAKGYHIFD